MFSGTHLPEAGADISTTSVEKRRAQAPHYQATNVEHLEENKAKVGEIDTRRLEMRRFDAQKGIEDLANDLDYLVGLAQECRAPGLIPLK